jgi:hypothetical protein
MVDSLVPIRTCTASFVDTDGLRHSVDVQAETLYEAAALAIRTFREHDCAPGLASQLEVEARSPGVTHKVSMMKIENWLQSSAKSPSDRLLKERLKDLLAT